MASNRGNAHGPAEKGAVSAVYSKPRAFPRFIFVTARFSAGNFWQIICPRYTLTLAKQPKISSILEVTGGQKNGQTD